VLVYKGFSGDDFRVPAGDGFPTVARETPILLAFLQFMDLLEPRFLSGFFLRFSARTGIALAPCLTITKTRIGTLLAPTSETLSLPAILKWPRKVLIRTCPEVQKKVKNGLKFPKKRLLKKGLHVFLRFP
jgi:hypothetical protein